MGFQPPGGPPKPGWQQPAAPSPAAPPPAAPPHMGAPAQPNFGAPPPAFAPPPAGPPVGPPMQLSDADDPFQQLGGMMLPQSKSGTLFGIPFSLMRDEAFLKKVLMISAIALGASLFIPFASNYGHTTWSWSRGMLFRNLVWPLLVGGIYGALVFLPQHIKDNVPSVVLKWAPFVVAFLSTGICYAVVPGGIMMAAVPFGLPAGLGIIAWFYPVLIFGLVVHLQDREDNVARAMIGIGGALSLIGYISMFDGFGSGMQILYNILVLLIILAMVAALAFAVPEKVWPQLAAIKPYAAIVTAILILWVPASALLLMLSLSGAGSMIFLFVHSIILHVAYFGVLMLTAPMAFDGIKVIIKNMGQQGGAPPTA